jgi:hypothetical protein
MASQHHDLDDFMRAVTDEIAREYDRIQRRATEDPGTAGDQGEENWATLLRGWLPPIYQVVTKGRILSHEGIASPQIDVLVLHPAYPRHLLDKKLYLAGGVAAAFECKITLKAEHIQTAVKNAVEIRNHVQARTGSPYKELYSPIVYGLLAHSHVWKGEGSTPLDNVERHLLAADLEHIKHPREMLDGICIADLATWIAHKEAWIGPGMIPDWTPMIDIYGPKGSAIAAYIAHTPQSQAQKEHFAPIGTMISHLLSKLAWEDPYLQRLARYFFAANVPGSGQGNRIRLWDGSIYSGSIRDKVMAGHLINGEFWNEWSVAFL